MQAEGTNPQQVFSHSLTQLVLKLLRAFPWNEINDGQNLYRLLYILLKLQTTLMKIEFRDGVHENTVPTITSTHR